MASFRLITTLVSYTPTATSADGTFPVTNISLYNHLFRPYKAAVQSATVDVTFDAGSGNTWSAVASNIGVFLDDVNFTTARIQGNTVTTSWGAPPWNQAFTISQDPWVRRYKSYLLLSDLNTAVFSYQYLNLRIPIQGSTDGAAYRIGRAAVGPTTEILANPLYGIQRTLKDPTQTVEFLDGGTEILNMGNRRMEITADRELFGSGELSEELTIQAIARNSNFVLWDSELAGSQYAWMFRRTEDPTFTENFLDYHKIRWMFREVL